MGNVFLNLFSCAIVGVAVWQHLGVLDGIAAGFAIYALMPWHPRSA